MSGVQSPDTSPLNTVVYTLRGNGVVVVEARVHGVWNILDDSDRPGALVALVRAIAARDDGPDIIDEGTGNERLCPICHDLYRTDR